MRQSPSPFFVFLPQNLDSNTCMGWDMYHRGKVHTHCSHIFLLSYSLTCWVPRCVGSGQHRHRQHHRHQYRLLYRPTIERKLWYNSGAREGSEKTRSGCGILQLQERLAAAANYLISMKFQLSVPGASSSYLPTYLPSQSTEQLSQGGEEWGDFDGLE